MSLVAATGIPSPSEGVWYLGPLPLRAYGIIIAIGMVVGVWWTARRYVARGGSSDTIYDVALWAIPLGVVGARLYHVVTSPEAYFGPGGDPMLAFQIWRGGLGIWGGVALGALGAYVGVKRALAPLQTRWPPRYSLPRASVGGGTGSTRSCSVDRRPCRGVFRSTQRMCLRATRSVPCSTRRSSTKAYGIWPARRSSWRLSAVAASRPVNSSGCT